MTTETETWRVRAARLSARFRAPSSNEQTPISMYKGFGGETPVKVPIDLETTETETEKGETAVRHDETAVRHDAPRHNEVERRHGETAHGRNGKETGGELETAHHETPQNRCAEKGDVDKVASGIRKLASTLALYTDCGRLSECVGVNEMVGLMGKCVEVRRGECTRLRSVIEDERSKLLHTVTQLDLIESIIARYRKYLTSLLLHRKCTLESMSMRGQHERLSPERPYYLIREIGRGGFSTVWKAWDYEAAKWLAVKVIRVDGTRSQSVKWLLPAITREIMLLKSSTHPTLLRTYDYFKFKTELSTGVATVHELCKCDLGSYIKERHAEKNRVAPSFPAKPLSHLRPAEAIGKECSLDATTLKQYFRDIIEVCACSALRHLHNDRLVVHMDIKPQNVLVTFDNRCRVCDLGIYQELQYPNEDAKGWVGTPLYQPPEYLRAMLTKRPYQLSAAYDIWSAGCIIAETLLARHPFLPPPDAKLDGHRAIAESVYSTHQQYVSNPNGLIGQIAEQDRAAADLVKLMLTVNPKSRLTAKDALKHLYLNS